MTSPPPLLEPAAALIDGGRSSSVPLELVLARGGVQPATAGPCCCVSTLLALPSLALALLLEAPLRARRATLEMASSTRLLAPLMAARDAARGTTTRDDASVLCALARRGGVASRAGCESASRRGGPTAICTARLGGAAVLCAGDAARGASPSALAHAPDPSADSR